MVKNMLVVPPYISLDRPNGSRYMASGGPPECATIVVMPDALPASSALFFERGRWPATMAAIVCGWIEDGTVARLEAEKRRDAAQRQRIADAIAMALMRERISVSTAHPFAVTHVPHAIRLALGSVGLDDLRRSLTAVARVIADQTDR